MQILLLAIIIVLSIVLYKMLSTQRVTYPFVRTSRITHTEDNKEYMVAEAEEGLITIDKDTVIVEGLEYSLKERKGEQPQAFLTIQDGRLLSIGIRADDEEKLFFIDPDHNLIAGKITQVFAQPQQNFIFSV
jgi:hypothetical protein